MIEDKERAKRLNEVYRYLYANKGVVSQTMFASQIGVQRSALSAAMNGNKLYLTNNLFMKVCAAYPDTFDLDYLITGEGSLLIGEQKQNELPNSSSINKNYKLKILESELEMLKRTNAALVATIESKDQVIATKDQLIDYLKRELSIRTNPSDLYVSDDLLNLKDNVSPPEK